MPPRFIYITVIIFAFAMVLVFFRTRKGTGADADAWVISQLKQAGSDLRKPHEIEFFLYFPNEGGAQSVASKLAPQGFNIKVRPAASGRTEWCLVATRAMVPELTELTNLREMFTGLAAAEKGDYDGWGAPVVNYGTEEGRP